MKKYKVMCCVVDPIYNETSEHIMKKFDNEKDAREYLKKILDRLERVQEEELAKAGEVMSTIKDNFGTTDVDDEDIEDKYDLDEEQQEELDEFIEFCATDNEQ